MPNIDNNKISHPKAKELNELEEIKKNAMANNDQKTYDKAVEAIKKIINDNQLVVSQEQWKQMNLEQKKIICFYKDERNEGIRR